MIRAGGLCLAFVACAVAANLATAHLGLVPLGFGLSVTAGTFAAGLALLLRDAVHEYIGLLAVFACIAAGSVWSYVTAGAALAVASTAAFVVSELADLAVYQPLRRKGWELAAITSGVAGAAVDTLLFLRLAGFATTPGIVAGQLIVKVGVTVFPLPVVLELPPRLCPVPGCGAPAARRHCMCVRCWSRVSAGVQEIEMVAYRAWCRGDLPDVLYQEALDGAIRSSVKARRNHLERPPRPGRPGEPYVPRKREALPA